jgi:hypothetical protein
MPRDHFLLRSFFLFVGAAVLACGGDEPADVPTTGTLEVTIATTGVETDANGYTVQVDAQPVQTIEPGGTVQNTGVSPGSHTVQLGEVAANCSIAGENPRTISVTAGQTATVAFSVTCSATTGAIQVTVTTSGSPADPDGYVAKLDARDPGLELPAGGSASFTGVTAGNHTVVLGGVASNCIVSQGASRNVRVAPGVSAEIALAVTCTALTGSIDVGTTTTGANPDPDGYTVSVDGGTAQPIEANGTFSVSDLAAGSHAIGLAGLAPNCAVEGDNPRPATVTAGASVSVAFTITCTIPEESPWTSMASGTTKLLTGVWGSSATDVFAVGEDVRCSTSCTVETSILHFDGTAWSTQLTQAGILRDIWAGSATDGFAVGADYPTYLATFLHNSAQGWSAMPSPAINVEGGLIVALWGSSATDVFAVGSLWPFDADNHEAYVAHYDGIAWTPMQIGPGTCLTGGGSLGCNVELSDVWGSSPTDVYAVGNVHLFDAPEGDRAVILHYNGRQWSEVLSQPNLQFRRIWGSSATDVYVTGNTLVPGGSASEEGVGAIWHFDGSSWSAGVSPTTSLLGAIWGSSATDIYLLAGAQGTSGTIWHFDGVSWTPTNTGANGLLDVWGSSATDVFVVGQNGTILHGPAASGSTTRTARR